MDKPKSGKIYALTGGTNEPSILAGNTWAESEHKHKWKKSKIDPTFVTCSICGAHKSLMGRWGI